MMLTQYHSNPSVDRMTELSNLADEKLPLNNSHNEAYDYVDYKYDKQGNWTEQKIYLNWEEKGSMFHLKIKRKIDYY